MIGNEQRTESPRTMAWLTVALFLALGWVYWPSVEQMLRRWSQDPQYTHGYVVPLFAGFVLWFRRETYPRAALRPNWWGLALVLAGGVLRLVGAGYAFEWLEAGSMLPSLAGLVLLCGGTPLLRWAWPAGAFLLFILPWPWQFDVLLTRPLRQIATVACTYALQTLGVPAVAHGNIIVVNELAVGVVEACSGLGMLMTFFALSTAVAFIVQRPPSDRIVVFLSAIPIGVLMNIVRITATVFLYRYASAEAARAAFHDYAGWVMMPMALGVLYLELLFLDRLWLPVAPTGPVPVPAPPLRGPRLLAAPPAGVRGPELQSRPAEADRLFQEIRDAAL